MVRGPGIKIPQLPGRQWHRSPRQPSHGSHGAPGAHASAESPSHPWLAPSSGRNSKRTGAGMTSGHWWGPRPRLLKPPLTAPCQLVVMLELLGIILVDPETRGRHRFDIFRGHPDRLVWSGVRPPQPRPHGRASRHPRGPPCPPDPF